jgi:UDP-GlcNAc3NAcA epimerase
MPRQVTIVGARPQFIKAAPLTRILRPPIKEVLVHTGQHYDSGMSDVFFDELRLKRPEYHLGISGGLHGEQTGRMLIEIERVLAAEKPDAVLVYGDTNSTLAGALAAAKLHIPVAHVEAGLRSFNRAMPEEINRVVTDHLATTLFAPSPVAVSQLANEGIRDGVHLVGDIMLDALLANAAAAREQSHVLEQLGVTEKGYYLCTIHRAENTDDEQRLRQIFEGLATLERPAVIPLHPRTKKMLEEASITPGGAVKALPPLGYFDMLELQRCAAAVLTDSGGVQKEAYYLGVPCVTLRNETEWVETIESGWNVLCNADAASIRDSAMAQASFNGPRPPLYGEGGAAEKIEAILTKWLC